MRQEFFAKLFIAKYFFEDRIESLIENQIKLCTQWIEEQDEYLINEKDQFQILLIDYRKKQIQAMIDWLDQVII